MKFFKKISYIVLSWSIEALNIEPKIDFAVGGQAVIEGVMMRSPNSITIAVRKPGGKVKIDKKKYQTLTQKYKWLNVPILRGVVNLFEMMIVGTKAINFSANESLEDDVEVEQPVATSAWMKLVEGLVFIVSLVLALALSIFLFKAIPLWTTTFLESKSSYIKDNYMVFNIIDGVIKTAIFISYIFLLSLIPSFRRIFEYHGAEHKSIFNYENRLELNVENAAKQTRFHPRCGTSFILIVFFISIVVYTFVPKQDSFLINLLTRLAFLPLIAGISYEYLKASAKHSDKAFVKMLIAPGLWFQRLTTKEPDKSQLEVGLESLKTALQMEKETT